jgi:hypothetical protein
VPGTVVGRELEPLRHGGVPVRSGGRVRAAGDVLEGRLVRRDQAGSRTALDAHVADRHARLHPERANRRPAVLEDMASAAADADTAQQRQDDVLGGDTGMEPSLDAHLERPRSPLEQRLRREDVLDLGRADAECQRAEGAMRRGVRVAAHDRHARLGQSQLGADDVDDPLVRRADAVERDAELAAVLLEPADLPRGDLVGDRQAPIGGWNGMVDRGDRLARPSDTQPPRSKPIEGLRAGHLVDEVQVHAQHVGRTIRAGHDDMLVPDLLDDRSRACAFGARSTHRCLRP